MAKTQGLRRPGSAGLDMAYLAAGRLDGFWELNLYPWDMAAGTLLIQEAGGIVTQMSGEPFKPEHRNIVAGNPAIHAALLEELDPFLTRIPK